MKFSCEKYLLQNACATAARAAASKSPIQALEGLLLEAGADVKVTGYDLKEGIYTSFAADVAQSGSLVVNSRLFGEIIRKLPDGIVTVATDGLNINVKCGKSDFNIMGLSPDDYPEMPVVDVAFRCGFEEASSFTHTFKRIYGMTPSQYREKQ